MSTGKRIVMIAVAVFLVLLIIGPWIAPQWVIPILSVS